MDTQVKNNQASRETNNKSQVALSAAQDCFRSFFDLVHPFGINIVRKDFSLIDPSEFNSLNLKQLREYCMTLYTAYNSRSPNDYTIVKLYHETLELIDNAFETEIEELKQYVADQQHDLETLVESQKTHLQYEAELEKYHESMASQFDKQVEECQKENRELQLTIEGLTHERDQLVKSLEDGVTEVNDALLKKDYESAFLKMEIECLEKEVEIAKELLKSTNDEINNAVNEVKKITEQRDNLVQENDELDEDIDALEAQLQLEKLNNSFLLKDLDFNREEIKQLTKTVNALESDVSKVQTLNELVFQLEESVDLLKYSNEELTAQLKTTKEERDSLKLAVQDNSEATFYKLADKDEENRMLKEKIESLEEALEYYRDELDMANRSYSQLSLKNKELVNQLNEMQTTYDSLFHDSYKISTNYQEEKERFNEDSSTKNQRINQLESEIRSMTETIDNMYQDYMNVFDAKQKAEAKLNNLVNTVKNAEELNGQLMIEADAMIEKITRLEDDNSSLKEQNEIMVDHIKSTEKKRDLSNRAYQIEISNLRGLIDSLNEELNYQKESWGNLGNKLTKTILEYENEKKETADKYKEVEKMLLSKISELENNLDKAHEANQRLVTENGQLGEINSNNAQTIDDLQDKYNSMIETNHDLKHRLESESACANRLLKEIDDMAERQEKEISEVQKLKIQVRDYENNEIYNLNKISELNQKCNNLEEQLKNSTELYQALINKTFDEAKQKAEEFSAVEKNLKYYINLAKELQKQIADKNTIELNLRDNLDYSVALLKKVQSERKVEQTEFLDELRKSVNEGLQLKDENSSLKSKLNDLTFQHQTLLSYVDKLNEQSLANQKEEKTIEIVEDFLNENSKN